MRHILVWNIFNKFQANFHGRFSTKNISNSFPCLTQQTNCSQTQPQNHVTIPL